jgi:DNA-binding transcriptional LysR family regulator
MFAWDDLKHFLAFAREGSILAAAKRQRVNQSTVQRRLAELEDRLGRSLIERHLGGYRLTEMGRELLPYAERIEEAVTAFERHLASCDSELTGAVRVTCTATVGDRLRRSPLFDAFHARFPGLRIELVLSDRFVDLSKREADIAIRSQGRELEDETLIGRKIAEGGWGLFASRSYIERHGRPRSPADLASHFTVRFDGAIENHSAARWLRANAPHAPVTASSESFAALVLAVKSGAVVAPLPFALGDAESELVCVIDDIPELVSHFYLLVHRDMQRQPRVRAFFDFVVSEIKVFRSVLSGEPRQKHTEKPTLLDSRARSSIRQGG